MCGSDPWDSFNPGITLNQVLNFMDQLMDAPFGGRGILRTGWDAREDDKSLYLRVEMPGLSKDDVKVCLEGISFFSVINFPIGTWFNIA